VSSAPPLPPALWCGRLACTGARPWFRGAPLEVCGDGILDPDEDRDDGNTVDGDSCSATCRFESGASEDGDVCPEDQQSVEKPTRCFDRLSMSGTPP